MTATQPLIKHPLAKYRAAAAQSPDLPELRWASPEAKLWVASRGGDFAGFVEFREGHYEVTDGRGAQLASCATLRDAKAMIARPEQWTLLAHPLAYAAIVTGGVTVSVVCASFGIAWMS
ncbi:hypothetical protein B0I08_11212 [Glaciihabitans tibetensis]|uniref:Uncharacterized protein n=1 Tax=Glaciihabitans tibetensis TaxID=1266600 RepID=A0A2T0V3I6_9MICO|nr:hypothetical protein [Glaciihabitans tibetensis]PRY64628.1 hypothetical protein B0I08_11212 [Glaciihabitans tibetensis]